MLQQQQQQQQQHQFHTQQQEAQKKQQQAMMWARPGQMNLDSSKLPLQRQQSMMSQQHMTGNEVSNLDSVRVSVSILPMLHLFLTSLFA